MVYQVQLPCDPQQSFQGAGDLAAGEVRLQCVQSAVVTGIQPCPAGCRLIADVGALLEVLILFTGLGNALHIG